MGAPLVAAAGSAAGGALGSAVAGTPKTYGPDTSIPGVTSATIKEGGKGKPDEKVPQVDIQQSLDWFREAAETQEKYYREGLQFYTKAMEQASEDIRTGFAAANRTLQPMSFSANQAMNEQMRMLGLDPISASAGVLDRGAEMGLSIDLRREMAEAEKLRDPTKRRQAEQGILTGLAELGVQKQEEAAELRQKKAELEQRTQFAGGSPMGGTSLSGGGHISLAQYNDMMANGFNPGQVDIQGDRVAISGNGAQIYNSYLSAVPQLQAQRASEVAAVQEQITNLENEVEGLAEYAFEYEQAYAPEYDAGYTGEEVQQRIEATPGYKFRVDQGTRAIERQGAAAGMLGSGNTLAALTEYGQGLGQDYYNSYLNQLSTITGLGAPATSQIAANQATEGQNLAALSQSGGQAYLSTYGAIGDAWAASLSNQAQAYQRAAEFNANMQFTGIENAKNRQADKETTATMAGPGYMNAALAQSKFNYGVFQNQQAGQAFYV